MLNVFITLPTGGTYFSYLKRLSDGLYYDNDDATFKSFASLVGRVEFVEDTNVPGQFSWSLDVADGDYVVYTLLDDGLTEINVAEAKLVKIRQGQEQVVSVTELGSSGEALEAEIIECE